MSEATIHEAQAAENGSPGEAGVKSVYITAPRWVDAGSIRRTLEAKGVRTFTPDQLDLPGPNLSQILRAAIERADLVLAVVDTTTASNFVYYEVGFAQALGKPTIALLSGDVPASTWVSSGIPYFRFDPEKPTNLDFVVSQVLKFPPHPTTTTPSPVRRTRPLGKRADELLAQLRAAGDKINEAELAAVIETAIRESGVATVSRGGAEDRYVDLAVWSDDLAPWVGNPLPIELRLDLHSTADAQAAAGRLARGIAGGGMMWGLLIYRRGTIDLANSLGIPNILQISAEEFLAALRTTSFGDLIRQLRNRRVHEGR
jgi:hypothetical protein